MPPGYDPETWTKGPASREKGPKEITTMQKEGSGTGMFLINGMKKGIGITNLVSLGMRDGKRYCRDEAWPS